MKKRKTMRSQSRILQAFPDFANDFQKSKLSLPHEQTLLDELAKTNNRLLKLEADRFKSESRKRVRIRQTYSDKSNSSQRSKKSPKKNYQKIMKQKNQEMNNLDAIIAQMQGKLYMQKQKNQQMAMKLQHNQSKLSALQHKTASYSSLNERFKDLQTKLIGYADSLRQQQYNNKILKQELGKYQHIIKQVKEEAKKQAFGGAQEEIQNLERKIVTLQKEREELVYKLVDKLQQVDRWERKHAGLKQKEQGIPKLSSRRNDDVFKEIKQIVRKRV